MTGGSLDVDRESARGRLAGHSAVVVGGGGFGSGCGCDGELLVVLLGVGEIIELGQALGVLVGREGVGEEAAA